MATDEVSREEEDQRQYEADLRSLMQREEFRRFVWKLLSDCQMFKSSMTGNAWTQFNEGMRNVGIRVTRDLHIEPDLYMQMWRENALREDFQAMGPDGKEERLDD